MNGRKSSFSFRDLIGGVLIVGFLAATGWLLFRAIPPENEQLVAYMLGQLSGFVAGVVAYHYVQKAGEKELDQLRTENTGKALDAIAAATGVAPGTHDEERPTGAPGDPVHVTEEGKP